MWKIDVVGKYEHILNITIYQVDFMSEEKVDAFLDHIEQEIFKCGFTLMISYLHLCEKSGEVLNLGGEKKLVRFNFCAIFVFDGEVVKLFYSFLLMIRFKPGFR